MENEREFIKYIGEKIVDIGTRFIVDFCFF